MSYLNNRIDLTLDTDKNKLLSFIDILELFIVEDTYNLSLKLFEKYIDDYCCDSLISEYILPHEMINDGYSYHNYILLCLPESQLRSLNLIDINKYVIFTYDTFKICSKNILMITLEVYFRTTLELSNTCYSDVTLRDNTMSQHKIEFIQNVIQSIKKLL